MWRMSVAPPSEHTEAERIGKTQSQSRLFHPRDANVERTSQKSSTGNSTRALHDLRNLNWNSPGLRSNSDSPALCFFCGSSHHNSYLRSSIYVSDLRQTVNNTAQTNNHLFTLCRTGRNFLLWVPGSCLCFLR